MPSCRLATQSHTFPDVGGTRRFQKAVITVIEFGQLHAIDTTCMSLVSVDSHPPCLFESASLPVTDTELSTVVN